MKKGSFVATKKPIWGKRTMTAENSLFET
jgi:hypothetical protein